MIVQGTALQIKEYRGKRVVTFKDIDTVHKRPDGTASRNFRENRQRFISGVDFYKITQPDEIRRLGITRPQGGTPNEVTLMTETGYLMLVKSFTDDLAWKVQRELVKMQRIPNVLPIFKTTRIGKRSHKPNKIKDSIATFGQISKQTRIALHPDFQNKQIGKRKVVSMKIRVTYSENEQGRKLLHEEAVKSLFPDTKVKETAPKDGFMHTVLTVPIEHKPTK